MPVFELPESVYLRFKPTIYPIPGTVFQTHKTRAPITADLAAHVVGTVGPITAEQLARLGAPYAALFIFLEEQAGALALSADIGVGL